jgi:hypothetical protein
VNVFGCVSCPETISYSNSCVNPPPTRCSCSGICRNAYAYSGFGIFLISYTATEWSDGRVINLGGLPGSTLSDALGINEARQVAGYSAHCRLIKGRER